MAQCEVHCELLLTAPNRNILTYLLTYLVTYFSQCDILFYTEYSISICKV